MSVWGFICVWLRLGTRSYMCVRERVCIKSRKYPSIFRYDCLYLDTHISSSYLYVYLHGFPRISIILSLCIHFCSFVFMSLSSCVYIHPCTCRYVCVFACISEYTASYVSLYGHHKGVIRWPFVCCKRLPWALCKLACFDNVAWY